MPETTPLIKAALNLRVGVGFDVYKWAEANLQFFIKKDTAFLRYPLSSSITLSYSIPTSPA